MNSARSLFTVTCSAILMVVAVACGDNGTENGKAISALDISPDITTLGVGDTVQFKLMATYSDGSTEDVTSNTETVWNTTDVENATVSRDGMVTAVDPGTVSIEAVFEGKKVSEDFMVMP